MIVIDMDMPTKCMNCQLLGRDTMYCQVYPRKDLNLITVANGKPDWCPVKCDIEDIKAEIEEGLKACIDIIENVKKGVYPKLYSDDEMDGRKITYEHCLKIIDKHIDAESEDKE